MYIYMVINMLLIYQGSLCTYLGTVTNAYMMRGYGISYVYEVLIPEVGSNIYQIFHLETHVACFCFDLQFYTRMDKKHKFVSSTGSESTELAKADDDDRVDDDVDADSDDNEGITMQL